MNFTSNPSHDKLEITELARSVLRLKCGFSLTEILKADPSP